MMVAIRQLRPNGIDSLLALAVLVLLVSSMFAADVGCDRCTCIDGHVAWRGESTDLRVSLLSGEVTISSSQIHQFTFYGPFEVRYPNCTQKFLGAIPCTHDGISWAPNWDSCHSYSYHTVVAIATTWSLLLVLLLIAVRYYIVRKYSHVRDHVLISSDGPITSFTSYYSNRPDELRRLLKGNRELKQLHHEVKAMKFTWVRLLVAMCLLRYPALTDARWVPERGHITSFFINAEGVDLRISDEIVAVRPSPIEVSYQHLYRTCPFTSSLWQEWYCSEYSCAMWGSCESIGPTGQFIVDKANFSGKHSSQLTGVTRYCQRYTGGCFAATACRRWSISYDYLLGMVVDVYSIFSFDKSQVIQALGETNCTAVINHELPDIYYNTMTLVRTRDGSFMLCPFYHNYQFPKPGEFGDVQIDDNGNVIMSRMQQICTASWWDPPKCDLVKSALPGMLEMCQKLPGVLNSVEFDMIGEALVMRPSESVAVSITCTESKSISIFQDQCGEIIFSKWGSRESTKGYFITARTSTSLRNAVTRILTPCSHKYHQISCDATEHVLTDISSDHCSTLLNITHDYSTDTMLSDYQQSDTFYVRDADHSWASAAHGLLVSLGGTLLSLFSGGSIVLIVVLVIVIRK